MLWTEVSRAELVVGWLCFHSLMTALQLKQTYVWRTDDIPAALHVTTFEHVLSCIVRKPQLRRWA